MFEESAGWGVEWHAGVPDDKNKVVRDHRCVASKPHKLTGDDSTQRLTRLWLNQDLG